MNNKEFLIGAIITKIGCKGYYILSNEPRFINNFRIHHYEIGLAIFLLALLKKNSFFMGIGAGLIVDDIDDLIKDIDKLIKNLRYCQSSRRGM